MILALLLTLSPTVDLAAVGDVMLGRYVGRRIAREGPASVFGSCSRELRAADLALGNLECVLTRRSPTANKQIRLVADPSLASSLASAGFDGLSVANNHSLDCGPLGLRDTVSALRWASVRSVDGRAQFVTVKGIRIALLGFSDFDDGARTYRTKDAAQPSFSGLKSRSNCSRRMACADVGSLEQAQTSLEGSSVGTNHPTTTAPFDLLAKIHRARTKADVVVVMWHWGNELSPLVSQRQKTFAKEAAQAGADVILGSHPHVLQPIEWLPGARGRRCLVAYSLGNFIFDARRGAERQTGILHVALGKEGVHKWRFSRYHIECGAAKPDRKVGFR